MDTEDGHAQNPPAGASSDSYRYAIRVWGHLDVHWSEWLAGMTIIHEESGVTLLEGAIIDQAALRGLLTKLQDMNLPILELQRLEPVTSDAPSGEEPPNP
jgi:hypothetical protein